MLTKRSGYLYSAPGRFVTMLWAEGTWERKQAASNDMTTDMANAREIRCEDSTGAWPSECP